MSLMEVVVILKTLLEDVGLLMNLLEDVGLLMNLLEDVGLLWIPFILKVWWERTRGLMKIGERIGLDLDGDGQEPFIHDLQVFLHLAGCRSEGSSTPPKGNTMGMGKGLGGLVRVSG